MVGGWRLFAPWVIGRVDDGVCEGTNDKARGERLQSLKGGEDVRVRVT